jgi:hypothetical protein
MLLSIGRWRKFDDHPLKDVAKFGYKPNTKQKS